MILEDSTIDTLAYNMTKCSLDKYKKNTPKCESDSTSDCIQALTGDSFTLFTTFAQYINNLCFYYRSIIWEKSSEFMMFKLLNTSSSVLGKLTDTVLVTDNLIKNQLESFNNIQKRIEETQENFKNISKFLENYSHLENKIQTNFKEFENNLDKNNEKIINAIDKLEVLDKVGVYIINFHPNNSNSILFFGCLSALLVCFIFFYSWRVKKIIILLMIIFYCIEHYLKYYYFSVTFEYTSIFINICLFYFLRFLYVMILFLILFTNKKGKKKIKKRVRLIAANTSMRRRLNISSRRC